MRVPRLRCGLNVRLLGFGSGRDFGLLDRAPTWGSALIVESA